MAEGCDPPQGEWDEKGWMEEDPLGVDPETMRRLGYRTVDLLVDRIAGLRDLPVLRHGTPAELARGLDGPPPEGPEGFDRLLEQLATDILPFLSVTDHPAYLSPASSRPIAAAQGCPWTTTCQPDRSVARRAPPPAGETQRR